MPDDKLQKGPDQSLSREADPTAQQGVLRQIRGHVLLALRLGQRVPNGGVPQDPLQVCNKTLGLTGLLLE